MSSNMEIFLITYFGINIFFTGAYVGREVEFKTDSNKKFIITVIVFLFFFPFAILGSILKPFWNQYVKNTKPVFLFMLHTGQYRKMYEDKDSFAVIERNYSKYPKIKWQIEKIKERYENNN